MTPNQEKISGTGERPLVDAKYIRTWLSQREIRMIRQGENPSGIKLSRKQVYNIIEGRSKNFLFRKFLVEAARENERIHGRGRA